MKKFSYIATLADLYVVKTNLQENILFNVVIYSPSLF